MIFYDTCSILELQNKIFESYFLISNITLIELESIKTSSTKDEEIKYSARKILHLLTDNQDKYSVILYDYHLEEEIIKFHHLIPNNDSRIIATALNKNKNQDDIIFITSDLSCYNIAKSLNLQTKLTSSLINQDIYTGYKEVKMTDTELANFYNYFLSNNENYYDLKINEYLLIIDKTDKIIDKYKWINQQYTKIPFYEINSKMFGKLIPKNGDPYQSIAIDSLFNNQITLLRGPAGTGKSWLSFCYMFHLLEKGDIDKIIIFANTVAVKGSAKLGFYPGSRIEKLLDSQIGNLLESKLGDRIAVERLIDDGKLIILPFADLRGYDTTGMKAVIYISEAQNLDIELMRLALQRIGEDNTCIIDGDDHTQVDMSMYAGDHNGIKRVSKIFRGSNFYGEITLKNIYRSKIAKLAQEL